tara:strand:+ start:1224 stop:1673 length:450 start_codon:yes stop_codon:yes gene_type:complete
MKNLLLKFKGWLGAGWNHLLNHFVCTCIVLVTMTAMFGYSLSISAKYEKLLNDLEQDAVVGYELVQEQSQTISVQESAIEQQNNTITGQGQLINRLVTILNQQKDQIEYQNRVIQELVNRLQEGGLLPGELPNNGKGRSEANWISDETL